MIVSAPSDYREAARRRLPRFLFDYIDGGAVAENTMNANAAELASVALRQRVLCGAGEPTLATTILDAPWAMPVALGPVGATGMYARRGRSPGGPRRLPRRDPVHLIHRVGLLD
ncbi:L-lactate dehydrogenase [Klebsiella pneumoniae]|uniref:L-lactate dehydrogenase n=1 Tax=Klebsiella pneumoniae TaxID=573 RepID=A0A2X3FBA4_KLEPN|nr:L-lactate dehydrogenase [Klebsiella pneumoniae]